MFITNFCIILLCLTFKMLCQSSFKSEYPGIKICQSENLQGKNWHHYEAVFKDLSVFTNNNCTHLQESLFVRGLKNIRNISFDSIQQIDGHLIIEQNDVESISFKNLVVIRGFTSKSHILAEENQEMNVALQVTSNLNLKKLDLSSLRSIQNHDVLFDNNPKLKYLPHRINWTELFEKPKVQKIHVGSNITDETSHDFCSTDCKRTRANVSFCWGPLSSQCQKKTFCENMYCDTCSYNEENKEVGCCDNACLGGCTGHGYNSCTACRNMLDGKKCVEICPSRFKGGISGTTQNKAFKYATGSFCATQCPDYMLPEETTCVHSCSDGYFKNSSKSCEKCHDDICKHNMPCDIIKMTNGDERLFVMNEELLKNLTNCTKIRGYIVITNNSFSRNKVTVQMLYDHLSNVEELDGGFSYYKDDHLRNLTFLSKLKTFNQANLRIGAAAYHKFFISHTKLEFLGLKSLKRFSGDIIIKSNDKLCYIDLPWKEMGSSTIRNYQKCKDEVCHDQCSHKGCWMFGDQWCYECKNFDAGGRCVSNCSFANGYFWPGLSSATNGSCSKCDKECAGMCNGLSPSHCIGGCVHNEENQVCVGNCSATYYSKKGTNKCLPCSEVCAKIGSKPRCTGPSDVPGPGGCNECIHVLVSRVLTPGAREDIEKCVLKCPPKTFARISNNENITKFVKMGLVCEWCHPLCSECINGQVTKGYCKFCEGFWDNERCVKACPKESTYNFKMESSSRVCLQCDPSCHNGCSGPTAWDCKTCKSRKVFNGTAFRCVTKCPSERNIEEMDRETSELICSNYYESKTRQDDIRRTKTVVGSILCMLLIVILTIIGVVLCLRKKASTDKFESELKARYSNLMEPNSKDENAFSKPPNMGRLHIISSECLTFEDESKPLGFGAFGEVFKGKWKVPKEDETLTRKSTTEVYLPVAIKVIKNIGNSDGEAIMQEAKIMSSVSHLHCLRFIGICLSYEKPCLVTAYVKEGSLDKFLTRNRSKITSLIMLSWAEQIADGMLYLTKRGIIHRDLAARNVLVSRLECVQITDFGLSKMLENTKDKEIIIKKGKVPIRWLAIETLLEGKYSYETDVWAYGVTLWEIFTFGRIPYEDQATMDISDFVLKGGRLPQPDICSLDVYIVLVNCWLESPNLRPDFEALMRTFMDYCKNPGRYLSIEGDPFEIPSPMKIEMTNFSNAYGDNLHFSGTAETMLPLLNGRDSIDTTHNNVLRGSDTLPNRDNDSGDILSTSNSEDLPTRSATRTSNIFKRFHEKNGPNNTQSANHTSNTSARTVPLASSDQGTLRGLSVEEDPRYVADPTDKAVKLRDCNPQTIRTQLSETPRFHSNPLIKLNAGLSYNLPPPPIAPQLNSDDGYLEPKNAKKASHIPQSNTDLNGYLEPVSTKNNAANQDEYISQSPRKSLDNNSNQNNIRGTHSSIGAQDSSRLPLINENRSPSNLYFPQNLIDDEYLEPQSKINIIK